MAYQALAKLYYKDESVYAQTYHQRFNSEDTVKIDFAVSQYPSFFVMNTEVLRLAYEIVKLDKLVSRQSSALPGIAKNQYSKKCLIDEIVLTNRIEGVHSSRKEIAEVLDSLEKQSGHRGKHHRFVGLVNRYQTLLTNGRIALQTCQDVRDIYDEVVLNEVIAENPRNVPDGAVFRKDITEIHSQTDKVIHKGLYPETEIISAMDKALAFLNNDAVDPLFQVCLFHYMIEYIHPFYDGNGRLGRFILSDCLTDILEPLLAYRISETIMENRNAYYKAFSVCNDPHNLGDLTPFLIMLLNMIYAALKDLGDSLNQSLIRWRRYERLASAFPESADKKVRSMYSYLIQAALFSENGISTDELMKHFRASYYIIKKLLGEIQPGMLISATKGKEKYYQADLQQFDNLLLKAEMEQNK